MAKSYLEKIDDILDKITSYSDRIFKILGDTEIDKLVHRKKPSEFSDQDVQKLQDVIKQVEAILLQHNQKVFFGD